jgi:hypothetical protein
MATGTAVVLGKKDQVSNHEMSITRQDAGKKSHTNVLWLYVSDKDSNGLRADALGTGAGVVAYCSSTGEGIRAFSDHGTAVYGEALRGGVAGVLGVGTPDENGEGGVATVGVMGSGTYAGVWGFSDYGSGVEGTASGGATGVNGYSQKGAGVIGDSGKGGHAGAFFGQVLITGDLDVQGAKGAAVPFPDKTLRRLYSMESPESWFEDFGEARLVNGKAEVRIDARFAAVVRGPYHVFITPYGNSNGLYVSRRTRTSFGVREQQQGKSTLVFSYRIVARRRDIPGPRFVKVTAPPRPKTRRPPALPTNNRGFAPRPR